MVDSDGVGAEAAGADGSFFGKLVHAATLTTATLAKAVNKRARDIVWVRFMPQVWQLSAELSRQGDGIADRQLAHVIVAHVRHTIGSLRPQWAFVALAPRQHGTW